MPIQATNNFVFIERDETETEKGGLYIPSAGQEKPKSGRVISVGSLVLDKNISENKNCLFHKGNGFDIEHDGKEYLVIEGEKIIALV